MNRQISISMLAFSLCMACGLAHATQAALHNDLDGDGRSDLVWRNAKTGMVVYWSGADAAHANEVRISRTQNLPGGFDLSQASIEFAYSSFAAPRSNLVVRDASGNHVGLQFDFDAGRGYIAFDLGLSSSLDLKMAGVGNFDAYNDDDFVFRNLRDGSNFHSVWTWDGYYGVPLPTVANLDWAIASVSDFDGDGRAELLWRNRVTGDNVIWYPRTYPVVSKPAGRVANAAWKIEAVADFNGDGKSDIFWRNTSTGANVIWNSGDLASPRAIPGVTNQGWQVTATGDFDGDGRFDLFWRNSVTGANVIWKSANAGTQLAVVGVTDLAWSTLK